MFLGKIRFKIDKPIYVIIDEYDYFANEFLNFKTNLFSNFVRKTEFVRKCMIKKTTTPFFLCGSSFFYSKLVYPINFLSTSLATSLPSLIAHTTKD